jgi:hypothetical protein
MHIEFHAFLKDLVLASGLVEESDIPNYAVDDCKLDSRMQLASNVAFLVNKKLRKTATEVGKLHTTNYIATRLVDIASKQHFAKWFEIESSGYGFINASPTSDFKTKFFEIVQYTKSQVLFQQESFVFKELLSQQNIACSDLLPIPPLEFIINSKIENPDIRELCLYINNKATFTFNDKLMLLALACDSELEAQPYILGLSNRQNIPWYVSKFLVDAKNYCSLLNQYSLTTTEVESEKDCDTDFINIERFQSLLLNFRNALFCSDKHLRLFKALACLINIIREFYSCYNRPEVRYVDRYRIKTDKIQQIADIIESLCGVVIKTMSLLENSCKDDKFTLQIIQNQ